MPKRMTRQTLRLLEAFLSDLNREWYGFDLMERTGLQSGTIYPMLHRLLEDEWLSSFREQIDPRREGRPPRCLYRLTGLGEREASAWIKRRAPASAEGRMILPKPHVGGASI